MKKYKCLVTRQVYFKNSHIDIFENTIETNEELVSLYKGFYREIVDTEEVKPVIDPEDTDKDDTGEEDESVPPPEEPPVVIKKDEKKKEPVVNTPEPDKRRGRPSVKK